MRHARQSSHARGLSGTAVRGWPLPVADGTARPRRFRWVDATPPCPRAAPPLAAPQRGGAMIRGKRHGPTNALRKRRSSGDAAQNTEEIATVSCSHFDFSLAVVWGEAAMLGRHNYDRATDSL